MDDAPVEERLYIMDEQWMPDIRLTETERAALAKATNLAVDPLREWPPSKPDVKPKP